MSKEIIEVVNHFNPKNLNLPNLYRWDDKFKRYYFEIDNVSDEVTFYPSVTTILSKVLPESEFLSMKKTELGKDYWKWMNELASQGTFIHQELAGFFETGTIDFTTIQDRIKNYILESKQQYSVSSWCRVVLPKIISLILFTEQHNVEPLLIESTVKYSENEIKWAGTIDLLAWVDVERKGYFGEVYKTNATHGQKGDPKESTKVFRELCLIDFKSGTADIDSYAMQLQMYKMAIEQNMDLKIDCILNVNPKKYLSGNVPEYEINIQNDNPAIQQLDYCLPLYFSSIHKEPAKVPIFNGQYVKEQGISSIFNIVEAKDYVKKLTKVLRTKLLKEVA